MKYIFPFLLVLLTFFSTTAQTPNLPLNSAGRIDYTEVVNVDSATAQALFSKAKLFIANAFVSATDVTKLEDANTSTVLVKGNLSRFHTNPFNPVFGGYVSFKFTIQCKEGRYKYSVTDLVHRAVAGQRDAGGMLENAVPECGKMYLPMKAWSRIKKKTNSEITVFITELKKNMSEKGAFAGGDNW